MLRLIIVAVCVSCCFGIDLRPYDQTARIMFIDNDFNKDNILERAEMDYTFEIYDTTPMDGRVSRQEYTNYITQTEPTLLALSHELYNIYDVDNDDILEKHDYDNFFNLMDSDGNNQVSETEFVRYWSILLESLEHLVDNGGISIKK